MLPVTKQNLCPLQCTQVTRWTRKDPSLLSLAIYAIKVSYPSQCLCACFWWYLCDLSTRVSSRCQDCPSCFFYWVVSMLFMSTTWWIYITLLNLPNICNSIHSLPLSMCRKASHLLYAVSACVWECQERPTTKRTINLEILTHVIHYWKAKKGPISFYIGSHNYFCTKKVPFWSTPDYLHSHSHRRKREHPKCKPLKLFQSIIT